MILQKNRDVPKPDDENRAGILSEIISLLIKWHGQMISRKEQDLRFADLIPCMDLRPASTFRSIQIRIAGIASDMANQESIKEAVVLLNGSR
jgi:hypothetical protein